MRVCMQRSGREKEAENFSERRVGQKREKHPIATITPPAPPFQWCAFDSNGSDGDGGGIRFCHIYITAKCLENI